MCVLISTDSMHSALLFSMNPMPPMSAARLKTKSIPSHRLPAGRQIGQIQYQVLGAWVGLLPLGFRLHVHRADGPAAEIGQPAHQVAPDEPACAGHQV